MIYTWKACVRLLKKVTLNFRSFPMINGHIFYIITRSLEERTALIEFLKEHGVNGVFHYVPLHSSPAGQLYSRACGPLEGTQQDSDCLLRRPMYHEMTDDDIEKVVEALEVFYQNS